MSDENRLWKQTLRLHRETSRDELFQVVQGALSLPAPWFTQCLGVSAAISQWLGAEGTGVTVFGVARLGKTLMAAACSGMAGPMLVEWAMPLAGLAASELSAQFIGDSKAIADYPGGWLGVQQAIAIPLVRDGRPLAVLEVRSHQPDHLSMREADILADVAAYLVQRWPPGRQTQTNEGGTP